jgi:hypothetical protein
MRSRIVGSLLGTLSILGMVGFSGGMAGAFQKPTVQDFMLIQLPFLAAFVLFVSSIGMLFLKPWSISTARLSLVAWMLSGISAIHFTWSFHPWGELQLLDKLRGSSGFLAYGLVLPLFLSLMLRRIVRK